MINTLVFLTLGVPIIELPKQISGQPNAFITIPAKTNIESIVKWFTPDAGLNIFPVELLKDTRTLVVTGPEGRFRIYAYTSDVTGPSDPAMCLVLIGSAPLPPNPPPGPVDPPQPPKPTVSEITEAAKKEDPASVKWLSEFYEELGKESQKEVYKTVADIFRAAKVAINKQFRPEDMANLRNIIGKRLNEKLPQDSEKALDKTTRDLMTQTFNQVSKELKQ